MIEAVNAKYFHVIFLIFRKNLQEHIVFTKVVCKRKKKTGCFRSC